MNNNQTKQQLLDALDKINKAFDDQTRELEIMFDLLTEEQVDAFRDRAYPARCQKENMNYVVPRDMELGDTVVLVDRNGIPSLGVPYGCVAYTVPSERLGSKAFRFYTQDDVWVDVIPSERKWFVATEEEA